MMPSLPHRHLDDECLNAVLDGEASEEQQAEAQTCADCSARLHHLAAVSVALAAPLPPSDGRRRQEAIAAALGEHDHGSAAAPLAPRRHRQLSPAWVAAAAVVVAGALAVPLVEDLGGGHNGQDLATSDDTAAQTAAGGDDSRAGGHDVGEIDLSSLGELAASIGRTRQAPPSPASAAERPEAELEPAVPEYFSGPAESAWPCVEPARRARPSLERLLYAGEGTVAGRPAVVLGFEHTREATPTVVVVVLSTDSCDELASASN